MNKKKYIFQTNKNNGQEVFLFLFFLKRIRVRVGVSSRNFLPSGRWDHCLNRGLASIHRNLELDVVQRHGRSHGVRVVFVVYPKVRVGGVTSPA